MPMKISVNRLPDGDTFYNDKTPVLNLTKVKVSFDVSFPSYVMLLEN